MCEDLVAKSAAHSAVKSYLSQLGIAPHPRSIFTLSPSESELSGPHRDAMIMRARCGGVYDYLPCEPSTITTRSSPGIFDFNSPAGNPWSLNNQSAGNVSAGLSIPQSGTSVASPDPQVVYNYNMSDANWDALAERFRTSKRGGENGRGGQT